MTKDVSTMKGWWLLSVVLVALMLEVLILAGDMPSALRAVSAVSVALWAAALVYFVVGRW
jgi:steroid 5-alpha reductase family enzyme